MPWSFEVEQQQESPCSSVQDAEGPPPQATSFLTQADALLRKNLTFQKRNLRENAGLVGFPILLCLLLFTIQKSIDITADPSETHCGCQACVDSKGEEQCRGECVFKLFQLIATGKSPCPEPHPVKWPVLLQLPSAESPATQSSVSNTSTWPGFQHYKAPPTPYASFGQSQAISPITFLVAGHNRSLAERLGKNLFGGEPFLGTTDAQHPLALSSNHVLGTFADSPITYFFEPAFMMLGPPIFAVQERCNADFSFPISINVDGFVLAQNVKCVQGLHLWCNSSSALANEIYTGHQRGKPEGKINEFIAAYDFLNTSDNNFDVIVWYNGTNKLSGERLRIHRAINMASNSFTKSFSGAHLKILLEFVKEMPKGATAPPTLNLSSLVGPLFFTWIIELLFPVILTCLVYEKQKNLRIIMKMHGLGDVPYWEISYAYFLFISSAYILCLVVFGSIIGLKIFTQNYYSIQFVFYFVYINLQIVFAFLVSTLFSDVKAATAMSYIYVLASGLLGAFFFQHYVQDETYSRVLLQLMELFPGFSLYRGIYELSQSSFQLENFGLPSLSWKDVRTDKDGLQSVLLIMIVEWPMILLITLYLDQVVSCGSGIKRHPLWFLPRSCRMRERSVRRLGYDVLVSMEKPDVCQEREVVEKSLRKPKSHAVVCDDLKKIYPGRDGNPEKYAVRGLSLALLHGECFGMLGPNGAGKTSFINMMTGLTAATSGTAFVQGLDIRSDMDKVYTTMGVCPQHDLLWETLTGREHLLFYGRLKNLKGDKLMQAVEESLRKVKLLDGGVADKLSGQYSGGMKRRLSVAISLIGNPHVVYMDEPSTGLDPVSKKNLWSAVQNAKQDKAIILTTHSMEEAEFLCDRVGIFVDGSLQCLGNPKELKARYGGYYILTMTTPSNEEEEVEKLALRLSPRANKVYSMSGTQKFQLPKQEVRMSNVFREVENARQKLTIQAWGLADATLEDVFIKVAEGVS